MLSAEKEQIKLLQNKTNVGQILNLLLSCQEYQGRDNTTAPCNGGCFNPFLFLYRLKQDPLQVTP